MEKLKSIALVFALLMIASFMSTCAASRPSLTANFAITASGGCAVLDDFGSSPGVNINLGTGAINFDGTSRVKMISDVTGPSSLYATNGRFRPLQRSVTVSWNDQSLSLRFIPKDTTSAVFFDDIVLEPGSLSLPMQDTKARITFTDEISTKTPPPRDFMFIGYLPNFVFTEATLLHYIGTYTNQGISRTLSGYGFIYVEPFQDSTYIILVLYTDQGMGIFEVVWFSEDVEVVIPDGTINVPAANPFITTVTINTP